MIFVNANAESNAVSSAPVVRHRKWRLLVGTALTFFPLVIWQAWNLVPGEDYIEKHAQGFRSGSDGIYISLLGIAGIVELTALYFLDSIGQKPRDWIFVCALIDAGFSIVLTLFFWGWITGFIFHGS
jgi:hypothetical protein